jgi:hypothetical protein
MKYAVIPPAPSEAAGVENSLAVSSKEATVNCGAESAPGHAATTFHPSNAVSGQHLAPVATHFGLSLPTLTTVSEGLAVVGIAGLLAGVIGLLVNSIHKKLTLNLPPSPPGLSIQNKSLPLQNKQSITIESGLQAPRHQKKGVSQTPGQR